MSYLTDADLAIMRADVAQMLPDSCVLQAASRASDGAGGWTETWAGVTGGTVACRVDPLSARAANEIEIGRETITELLRLTVPYDAPLDEAERVEIGGAAWEIVSRDAKHSWRVSRRAVIALVSGE